MNDNERTVSLGSPRPGSTVVLARQRFAAGAASLENTVEPIPVNRLAVQQRIDGIRALLAELESQVQDLVRGPEAAALTVRRPQSDTPGKTVDDHDNPEYLSVRDLARRIPYAEQTIRNLMASGVFRLGEHYIKPRSRIVFRWSKVRAWLEQHAAER